MTSAEKFHRLGIPNSFRMVGWDPSSRSLCESIAHHGVVPDGIWRPVEDDLGHMEILAPPPDNLNIKQKIKKITKDIKYFNDKYEPAIPVFANLLPASASHGLRDCRTVDELYAHADAHLLHELAYVSASIECGIPVVNFASNDIELLPIAQEAVKKGVPMCGRDGKTGQTYLKVVLASALKARGLYVDGWYSVNILGNGDGENLADPGKAAGKLANKTKLLDDLLGYRVGERYGKPSHTVRIDYYAPRGDAKEAWDVIDFMGLFGLPMSLRLNLQGRDSILAAPMILDLARWMVALQQAGRSGLVPELGFFFKRPVGDNPPLTFQDQMAALEGLERFCEENLAAKTKTQGGKG